MTIKRRKTGRPTARKRRLRPAAPKVARARPSDTGEITSKPMLIGYARRAEREYPRRLRTAALSQRWDAPGRFQLGGGRRQCADSGPSPRSHHRLLRAGSGHAKTMAPEDI